MPVLYLDNPHALSRDDALSLLDTSAGSGLTDTEVIRRRKAVGLNRLRQQRPRNVLTIIWHQFRGVVVWLLAAAAVFSLVSGDALEAVAILAVLAINGAIGFIAELRATRSMEALSRFAETHARVRREGRIATVDARDLVPGDIVILEAGDVVTADLRLISASGLQCNQSILTGESAPVDKDPGPVPETTYLGERSSMAYKGSAITRGSAEGVVAATGVHSEIGRISLLVAEADMGTSPLEERLDTLGRKLVWLMLALAAVTIVAGYLRGHDLLVIMQTGVALAVAAVPEGLPVVATLTLARGMWRMARRNAIIRHLASVETLGTTTMILTDKTGTLTENRMTVARYLTADGDTEIAPAGPLSLGENETLALALRIGALCNTAALADDGADGSGDPMEQALLAVAQRAGLGKVDGAHAATHAFDPDYKMMAQVQSDGAGFFYAVKGAPEAVIAACTQVLTGGDAATLDDTGRQAWLDRGQAAADEGLRCLALATKRAMTEDEPPYRGLTLVGLVALSDPLRADVAEAIAACTSAGVRVVMVTGDHAATATRIGRQAGIGRQGTRAVEGDSLSRLDFDHLHPETAKRLVETEVFARIAPDAKWQLVRFFQNAGDVVAMTGDGVNDAPALRQADIGIAMGKRGTQVAREAADMVLRDDAFSSIVAAIREGRVIFGNIRTFVIYLMSCNVSEVLVVALAVAAGLPAPLLPLQILYLNLVTDVFPAFALGLGQGDDSVMREPPRHRAEPFMDRRHWRQVAMLGGLITAATLMAFLLALSVLSLDRTHAVTVAFLTLSLAQLWNVFNMNAGRNSRGVFRNPLVWWAIAICLGLLALAIGIPSAAAILSLPWPGAEGFALALGCSLLPVALWQLAARLTVLRAESGDDAGVIRQG